MRTLLSIFSLGLISLSTPLGAQPGEMHHADHRHGAHGMLLFGASGEYFLSHIPMFQEPHNEQLVMKVKLVHQGHALTADFSQAAFSLSPEQTFSLDNLVLGKLKNFSAAIFNGSFEAGGTQLMDSVEVKVVSVLVARNLPGTVSHPDGRFSYFLVQSKAQGYLLNYITAKHPWQSVVKLNTPEKSLGEGVWLARSTQRIRGKSCLPINVVTEGSNLGIWFRANTVKELWCLKGPGFFHPCD